MTTLDHVGVAVVDLEAAIEFYSRAFGFTLVHEEVNEDAGIKEVMLAIGDSGTCIQLLAPLNPESVIARFLDRAGPGVQHVAKRERIRLRVADPRGVEQMVERAVDPEVLDLLLDPATTANVQLEFEKLIADWG